MIWAVVVNAILGAWFIASPFVLRFTGDRIPMDLSIAGGAILLLLSLWQLGVEERRRHTWADYVSLIIGLGFIAFPFAYRLQSVANVMWTSVVGGLLVMILSAYLASGTGTPSATGAKPAHS